MRLQQFIASCGLASRRAAERMIEAGRVTVNGTAARLGDTVDPETDRVSVDGKLLRGDKKVYIIFHKPAGVITTLSDTHGRSTIMDYLTGVPVRVYPVGRLDLDVEGALLLTNDGDLAWRLTHPSFGIEKVYHVLVRGEVAKPALARLEAGVELEDGRTAPARARVMARRPRETLMELVLHEGRKREVKRMCRAVGHPVLKLSRHAFASLTVADLRPGEWRHLSKGELATLRSLAGVAD